MTRQPTPPFKPSADAEAAGVTSTVPLDVLALRFEPRTR